MTEEMNSSATPFLVRSAPLGHIISLPFTVISELRPVLCFLHGYGEAAPMAIREALTLHGPLQSGNSQRVTERFIIVAPQLPTAGNNWNTESAAIRQIVTAVQTEFRGNPDRTYLTGFSFGGNGVFDIGIAQPSLWAALWPVDPTRPPKTRLQRPLWLSLGEISRRQRTAFTQLMRDDREVRPQNQISNGDCVFEDRERTMLALREWLMGTSESMIGYLAKLDLSPLDRSESCANPSKVSGSWKEPITSE